MLGCLPYFIMMCKSLQAGQDEQLLTACLFVSFISCMQACIGRPTMLDWTGAASVTVKLMLV